MDSCDECGFVYGALARTELPLALAEAGRQTTRRLSDRPVADPQLTHRRRPDEWSPLEYLCHVRDVLLVQRDRLYVALVEDEPSFKPMYRDQRVEFDRYGEQAPDVVAAQLLMATAMTAHAFAGLRPEQWERPLIYGYPAPVRRNVEWMAQHTLHEMVHHDLDVQRILDADDA